ncbi:MAG: diguanylate cyclase (GGDEF)-like protein/PAS domain S-box-containing protein [Candidatus Azotimanducaceae bacterium]|jgi:diguanylate cyclase (GGDEF)-like protein/PAS domain S-box-containing protein
MPPKTLLLVEDEVLVARDITARLTRMGYEVIGSATRGLEAVEKALSLRPDLILMDINLKDEMDGVEAAIRIRHQYDVPVIFCTAYSNDATLERAKVSEPYGYVLKPFDNRELNINIEIALYKHQAERDLADTHRRLDATLANITDAVIAADMSGQILLMNPVAEQLTGWRHYEARTSSLATVLPLASFLPGEAVLDFDSYVSQPLPRRSLPMRQYIDCLNGGRIPVEISVSVLYQGKADLIVITFRNIQPQLDAEEKIRRSAFFDDVTQLPNRALFINRLERSLQRRKRGDQGHFAVIFLDLDGFSAINEGLGHGQGDRVLTELGERMVNIVRPEDTLSRISGDVFAILLDPIDSAASAIETCQRLQYAVSRPLQIESQVLEVSASAGIALHQEGYHTADELIRDADTALHRAKAGAGGSHVMFDQGMYESALKYIQLKSYMQQAVIDQGFEVHYQPIIDINTGKLVSMEALARWYHPTRGQVSPEEFIPLAEKTGLILPLGEQILRMVCEQLKRWDEEGFNGFRVAVNLSARQFESNVVLMVENIIAETGISPNSLALEITEGIAMQNVEHNIRMLEQLRALGVTISIDDFGTGYSSLAYLKRFPLNTLKIDKSFIQDLETNEDDQEITRVIITLGQNLKLKVLAEGVETPGQLDFLRRNGCDLVQGYIYSRPMPADQVIDSLTQKCLFQEVEQRVQAVAR